MYCEDHLGNKFRTKGERAAYYGFKASTVDARLKNGMSLEQALTTDSYTVRVEAQNKANDNRCKRVIDHLGNKYSSLKEMCATYDIEPDLFCHRLERGWSLEDALGPKKEYPMNGISCEDIEGNKFDSISSLCKFHGIKSNVYLYRKKMGRTPAECQSKQKLRKTSDKTKCKDHLGNEYNSESEMAEAYGISGDVYRGRKRYGWTVEERLTIPLNQRRAI